MLATMLVVTLGVIGSHAAGGSEKHYHRSTRIDDRAGCFDGTAL